MKSKALAIPVMLMVAVLIGLRIYTGIDPELRPQTITGAEGNFVVTMPDKAKKDESKVASNVGELTEVRWSAEVSKLENYTFGYTDYPKEVIEQLVQENGVEALYTNGLNGMLPTFPNAKLISKKDVSIGKYTAQDIRINATSNSLEVSVALRFLLVNNRLYQMLAMVPRSKADSDRVIEFFNSFKLQCNYVSTTTC